MAAITETRLRAGVWQGVLTVATGENLQVDVFHLEAPMQGVTVTAIPDSPNEFLLSVPIPARSLNDGVQTYVVQNSADGATLASFSIIAGRPLDEDLRAEIDLLRVELDLLKRAFRRHCVETT